LLPDVQDRKREIQKRMIEGPGLRVDFPNPLGGNSNDGNTARRAFDDIDVLVDILGLDRQMLINFKRILVALTCQLPIISEKFGDLCRETAVIFHNKYSWYFMPCTLHKILAHGREIMESR